MKDVFSTYHPLLNFLYFTLVLVFSMFFLHPVFLVISFGSALTYSTFLKGWHGLRYRILVLIPTMLLIALINPAFNHQGMTILFYLKSGNPITLESIAFGIASAVMFVSVFLWFSCYNMVMTSDKFIYLFGRVIPALSLIFSMVLRFVPKLKAQAKRISDGQRCLGRDIGTGSLRERIRHGLSILSILTTWSLENAIETADSMRSRGYGLAGRTSFSLYRFDRRDRALLVALLLLAGAALIAITSGGIVIKYFPIMKINGVTPVSVLAYLAFAALCLLPVILQVMEDLKWRYMK